MDTPPAEESCDQDLETVGMQDSLFPFISENFNQFTTSGHTSLKGASNSQTHNVNGHLGDSEAHFTSDSQMDLTEVDVFTQLEHKERDLMLAAELGKSLLEKNTELSKENERLNHDYHQRLETLQQENHELRRKLDCKTSECESNSFQLHNDIKCLQEDLVESRGMVSAVEREKSRAVAEISEQNHKLLVQLQRASEAESQLSSQVQHLRKEFLERTSSNSVKIRQLESQKEEKEENQQLRAQLESNFDAMKDESAAIRDELAVANERVHQLERQVHDKERELKRYSAELNDAHLSNRQLQVRVDELREEMSLHMSFTSNGNSSLLAELEQTGVDCSEILAPALKSHDDENKLKQEMWETYQRIMSITTVLRAFISKSSSSDRNLSEEQIEEPPHSPHAINLSSALTDLSDLIHEALHSKEVKSGSGSEVVSMLREKQCKLMQERDEAVASKNHLEVSLASAKVDLMAVNSQLLEAIQQKLQQQKEIEAWQDDMELMIQKALNERNELKRANSIRHKQSANQEQSPAKSSWFSFSRKNRSTPDSSAPSSTHSSPHLAPPSDSAQSTGRFSNWLKRKSHSSSDQPITETEPVT